MFQSRKNGLLAVAALTLLSFSAHAAPEKHLTPILADVTILQEIGVQPLVIQADTGIGFAKITGEQRARLQEVAHHHKKCGGYEALPDDVTSAKHDFVAHSFGQLAKQEAKRRQFVPQMRMFAVMQANPVIQSAIDEVSEANLKSTVTFLSSFPDRFNKGSAP
ncbi:MAG: hypothetical protein AAB250_14230, partial [Bdellovibrionota bacterium]